MHKSKEKCVATSEECSVSTLEYVSSNVLVSLVSLAQFV
jgi:hypothetical protein